MSSATHQVVYKLDTNGSCVHIDRSKFGQCVETSFSYWTDTEFRRMAVSSAVHGIW